jgi:uncharacterized protein with beta-barrel porin domain
MALTPLPSGHPRENFKPPLKLAIAAALSIGHPPEARAGLTPSQQTILSAIEEHCPALHNLAQQGLVSGQQAVWADTCWDLLNTYYAVAQPPNVVVDRTAVIGGITTLGQVGDALTDTSQFKPLTLGQGSVQFASGLFALLSARLEAVRLGATGFSLAALNPGDNPLYAANGLPATGGAAGDEEETGGLLDNRLSFFMNGDFNYGNRSATEQMAGFGFDSQGATAGADYRFSENFVAGLAGRYVGSSLNVSTGGGGAARTDTYGLSSYASYYVDDFHLDAAFSYQWSNYTMNRVTEYGSGQHSVDTRSFNSTSGTQYAIAVGGGYDFHAGGLALKPEANMQYLRADTDAFDEFGSASADDMHVDAQSLTSLITTVGGRVNYTFSTDFGVLIPELRLTWNHEFENDARTVTGFYRFDIFKTTFGLRTDNPDRDYGTVSASLSGQFAHGISAFVNYGAAFGLSYSQAQSVTAGLRMEY